MTALGRGDREPRVMLTCLEATQSGADELDGLGRG